jgi:DNA-directed RNA polymerase specialized sigma24 family protein
MDILKRVRDPTSCLSSDGAYTLVLNTVRKSIRSHTRQRRQQPHSAGETGEIPRSFNSTFRAPTNWRQVHSALTTHLSSLEACVFWDTQVVQRSIRDVAGDVYGVPNVQSEQRVRRALSTARRKLRAHLDPDYLRALRLPESPPPIYASLCDHPSPPQSCWDTP